jgi:restriction system protein
MNSYDIDRLDGYDFEELVHQIFSRHGFKCQLMPKSRDGGIDVIAANNEQEILIECKHWKGNAGRPIVQKLHSAVMTYNVNGNREKKGIVVCTGNFSPDAIEYVLTLKDIMDLWDYSKIRKFAYDVGIILYSSRSKDSAYFGILAREEEELKKTIVSDYVVALKSHPRNSVDACLIRGIIPSQASAIRISYKLDKSFSTSVGKIHRTNCNGVVFKTIGDNNNIDKSSNEYLEKANVVRLPFDETLHQAHGNFLQISKTQEELNIRHKLSEQHTKQVIYTGKNNQQYNKICEIRPQDIKINSIYIIYNKTKIHMSFGPRNYELDILDDIDRAPHIIKTEGFDYGGGDFLIRRASLCNDCGAITSSRRSYICEICKKTLCQEHIWSVPLNSFGRTRLCHMCFDEVVLARTSVGRAILNRSDVAITDDGKPNSFIGGMGTPFGVLTLLITILVGVVGGWAGRFMTPVLSKTYQYSDMNINSLIAFGVFAVLGVVVYYVSWSKRSLTVNSLKVRLKNYSPAWK